VTAFLPEHDPLHKVTIIPRGRALGVTMQLPAEDKHNYTRNYIGNQIAILMGGRIAEEMSQKDITTGASNDIERATAMARRMVCEWGMSELGPLAFGQGDEPVFLGRDFQQRAAYSEETAQRIDAEVQRIVRSSYERAHEILRREREVLDRIARELLEHESLDGGEIYRIIEEMTGQKLEPVPRPPKRPEPPASGAPATGAVATPAKSGAAEGPPLTPEPSPA
jgi:cell division protease FtsH